ncbi:sodium-dependent transporter [Actinotalea sp. AC32]|nr:sodium-dependent transporter [Actinotalea sp. AC32]
MAHTREQWSGQLGFILAAVGSAVGLGNIWRFPGVAYENGGGAFLIPYLVALLTAGIPVLLLDYSIGHRFRGSAPTSFRRISRPAESLGWFQVGISIVIMLYYTVIIAWAASYTVFAATQAWGDDPAGFLFGEYLRVPENELVSVEVVPGVLIPMLLIWGVTIVILALGVQKGLERANVVFIPLLVVMFAAIVVRAVTLPGAADGLNAFFTPDFGALRDPGVWIAAYGQIFFSLSIAFGIMVTYASYLRRRANLTSTALVVGFGNSSFELLAGIGVFSALGFMASQQGVAVADLETIQGVGLAFVAFPQLLSLMPGGPVFGVLFFASLTLAGLTSLISIMQVVSAAFQEKLGWSTRTAAVVVGGSAAVISTVLFSTTTGVLVLDVADKYINEVGVVGSAVVTALVLGLVLRRLRELQTHLNDRPGVVVGGWWRYLIAIAVPLVLGYIFVSGIRTLLTERYGDMPAWFLTTFGWGSVAVALLVAVGMTLVPWRRPIDEFVPDALPGIHRSGARVGGSSAGSTPARPTDPSGGAR